MISGAFDYGNQWPVTITASVTTAYVTQAAFTSQWPYWGGDRSAPPAVYTRASHRARRRWPKTRLEVASGHVDHERAEPSLPVRPAIRLMRVQHRVS